MLTRPGRPPGFAGAIAAVLLLVACNGGKSADGDGDEADTDSDTDADSDTDSDADTDTDSESPFGLDARPPNLTCLPPDRPIGASQAQLTRTFAGISHSSGTMMLMAPGDTSQWYLIEQAGRMWRFDNDPAVSTKTLVMDITGPVLSSGAGDERGLLGMAFHPDFQNNGYVYLYYSSAGGGPNDDHEAHLARFTSFDGGQTFDPDSEEILMVVDEPYYNHNGGTVAFGPDGYLYWGLGDGGLFGDPGDRAQDPNEHLGKMLRIDVDGGDPYTIPPDNPFASGGGRSEIFAMGLRNPFRFSFDSETGELWVGDVGQDAWEEVSKVELGGNYGWNFREGYECYSPQSNCPSGGLAIPYAVYENGGGSASVIGGVVYHGDAIPGLRGTLLYNDFYDGDIMGLFFDPVSGLPAPQEVVSNTGRSLVHYSTDAQGEVYILDYDGQFSVLEPLPNQPTDDFPRLLSETGCFDPADPSVPAEGLVPYDVAHPFWADGADKRRWIALPEGTTITIGDDGDWELPIGSVLAKEFSVGGERIETRLLVLHEDGVWGGYAYDWNDDQTDAEYVDGGRAVDLTSQVWAIPDTGECARCHTVVGGGSLGLENLQLNTPFTYESTGRTANQVATLDHIGMFSAPAPDPTTLGVYPAVDDTAATVEDRARAYLHVNCAQCHQPDGPSRTDIDFRYSTPLDKTNICDVDPVHGELDVNGAKILAPGDPSHSVLSLRMHRRDANQMPPIGTTVVDEVGASVIDEWITGLGACP